jgi:hypothetical protein
MKNLYHTGVGERLAKNGVKTDGTGWPFATWAKNRSHACDGDMPSRKGWAGLGRRALMCGL